MAGAAQGLRQGLFLLWSSPVSPSTSSGGFISPCFVSLVVFPRAHSLGHAERCWIRQRGAAKAKWMESSCPKQPLVHASHKCIAGQGTPEAKVNRMAGAWEDVQKRNPWLSW